MNLCKFIQLFVVIARMQVKVTEKPKKISGINSLRELFKN